MAHHPDDATAAAPGPVREIADGEPIQLLVQPWLRPHLFAFMRQAGLDVGFAPWLTGEEDLPLFLALPATKRGGGSVDRP